MNFWKMFGASLLAWVAGFVGLFFFFIGTRAENKFWELYKIEDKIESLENVEIIKK